MENKLDYLAAKEEELRRLNEQLDRKKDKILSEKTPIAEESLQEESKYSVALQDDEEDEMAAFKGVQLNVGDQSDENEDYHDEDFDDSKAASLIAASVKDDWQAKYRQLEADYKEQAKTVNF